MQITITWIVPSTADQTYANVTQVAYLDEKCEAAGALSFENRVTEKDGGHVVTIQRQMPSGGVPALVKKIVGDKVDVFETFAWGPRQADGGRRAALHVQFKGQPITMKGTSTIVPDGTGSRYTLDAALKAKIPIIGRTIEKMGSPEIIKAIEAEEGVSREWASGRR
ncbi:DUF2505 domain-containing protein [Luteipulveratus mongoliensis]|uniref:DUF2505 domain-containing protein n=1 Tax=Luteipulveratus mongoliensis TaxID=571913 RepID=A0A0K1JGM7_9MICO|nr:DUF2505 domain-containing protein [Luteipulveratus mongoliensis]AKU15861.1 hypothetical protein VV02_08350 [Luteipulveratus mongoliensis]